MGGRALLLLLFSSPLAGLLLSRPQGPKVEFEKDVRPILAAHCVECHSGADPKAGLRLDRRAAAFAGSSNGRFRVLYPGDAEGSPLYRRLVSDDDEARMPQGRPPLPPEATETIRRWIEEGASWPPQVVVAREERGKDHWAYRQPKTLPLPTVRNEAWVRDGIDRFVLARLEKEGLEPSPEADRATWLRRASLDLAGLPPSIEELDAFLADATGDAFERQVDRLLASPHYGERQAALWLDLARFADTNGYEKDARRSMWPWRDWVISAFNEDLPFDRFTIEQIAGDLLPGASRAQRIATGFHRNTMTNEEGGADPEEFRVDAVIDRVNTTAAVWLGTTLACAQCHDHKYDPFPQRDYYRLYAFFNQSTDGGSKTDPRLEVPSPEQERALAQAQERIAGIERRLAGAEPSLQAEERAWAERARAALPPSPEWRVLPPRSVRSREGSTLTTLEDGSVLASGENPPREVYEASLEPGPARIATLRLEALPDPSLPERGAGRAGNSNFVLTGFEVERLPAGNADSPIQVRLVAADADHEQQDGRFRVGLAIDGDPATGWGVGGKRLRERRVAVFLPAEPIALSAGESLRVRLSHESEHAQHSIGRFRISATGDAMASLAPPEASPWRLAGPYPTPSQAEGLGAAFPPEKGITEGAPEGGPAWEEHAEWRDGLPISLPSERGVAYFERTLRCETPVRLRMFLGGDDAMRVWLNGALVHRSEAWPGFLPDQAKVDVDLKPGENRLLVKVVNGGGLFGFYFDSSRATADRLPMGAVEALRLPEEARGDPERDALRTYFRRQVSETARALDAELASGRVGEEKIRAEVPTTLVLEERAEKRPTHLFVRGSFLSPGEEVEPGAPAALGNLPEGAPRNRLGLARWLVSPENPLTARVTANRLWMQLFGHGIVPTPEDFGTRGEPPSHPELLDYLALEFVASGWDVKALLRRLVLSATYRQSSRASPALLERDPENVLLARGPRVRLDAEAIRDLALAASGLLDRRIGGPSVFPLQPEGVWAAARSDDRWKVSEGGNHLRRGLYTFWRRTSPYATFSLFDAPSREVTCTRRARSNTPLQALALLNDPAFVECAQALAGRMLGEAMPAPQARIARGFRLCTGREPDAEESDLLARLLEAERQGRTSPADLRAWTSVASVLLNLDETVTKN
jgi:uncharacterized protein DUF1553/uncharacterized protein DUF1549/cytochrome c